MEASELEIIYLTPVNAKFTETEGHMLSVTVEGREYPVVFLHCSFPHSNRRKYISVRTPEHVEAGLIPSLDIFPEPVVQLLEKHVKLRYFAPQITKVNAIREEYGHSYWDTETSAGACRFTVKSGGNNLKMVSEHSLLISDVDGNRFMIERLDRLSDREYRLVEMCM